MGQQCSCDDDCSPPFHGAAFGKPLRPEDCVPVGLPVLPEARHRRAEISLGRGAVATDCGVLQVKTPSGRDLWLVYRAETARWLAVLSTIDSVPFGSTAAYAGDVSALAARQDIKMRSPDWSHVLRDGEIQASLAQAERGCDALVARMVSGRCKMRQMLILLGPPCSGKTTWSHRDPRWQCLTSVRLARDEVVAELAAGLFRKLALARDGAKTDPYERDAFLLESLSLCRRFEDLARRVIWDRDAGALAMALRLGVAVVVESCGDESELPELRQAIEAAHAADYRVLATCIRGPPDVLRRRCEERFERELSIGVMLGGRHFDALVDRLAEASRLWPDLAESCTNGECYEIAADGSLIPGAAPAAPDTIGASPRSGRPRLINGPASAPDPLPPPDPEHSVEGLDLVPAPDCEEEDEDGSTMRIVDAALLAACQMTSPRVHKTYVI